MKGDGNDGNQELRRMLLAVGVAEEQLEAMREALNQELLFNLEDVQKVIGEQPNCKDLITFIGVNYNETVIESLIHHYNNNTSTKLSKKDLSKLLLTRQNKLLARLVSSRLPHGKLSHSIIEYVKKILKREAELHEEIVGFRRVVRKRRREEVGRCLEGWEEEGEGGLDGRKVKEFLMGNGGGGGRELGCEVESILEYFDLEDNRKKVLQTIRTTLLKDNSQLISTFLNRRPPSPQSPTTLNPLVHPQFHKLLSQPQLVHHLSYRQAKSIEKHLKRVNSHRRFQISKKVDQYRRLIEKQVRQLCISLKDIVWLEKEMEYSRVELSLCMDFNAGLFFNGFCLERNGRMIASAMEEYLRRVGVQVQIQDIYLLFKRFSRAQDGKLDLPSFSQIFSPVQQQYRQIKQTLRVKSFDDISSLTKKSYLEVLVTTIKNQSMIQKIRQHLNNRKYFDLRNIFNCIDADEDGYISVLDMHVMFKRNIEFDLARLDVRLLLERFGKKSEREMVSYEEFVYEMAPRVVVAVGGGGGGGGGNKSKLCF